MKAGVEYCGVVLCLSLRHAWRELGETRSAIGVSIAVSVAECSLILSRGDSATTEGPDFGVVESVE